MQEEEEKPLRYKNISEERSRGYQKDCIFELLRPLLLEISSSLPDS